MVSLARRLRRTRLGVKLALLGAALTAFVIIGTFIGLDAAVRSTMRRMYAEELGRNRRTLVELQRNNLEQLLLGASLITRSPTIRAALTTYQLESKNPAPKLDQLFRTVDNELADVARDLGKT